MMDRFSDLEAFVMVVESGSFSAASERLHIAKSAISRRLSGLEDRLGARLLNRTTRRLSLTESGRVFYEQARRILLDLEDAERQITDQQGEVRGLIRLAAPLSFALWHLSDAVADFMQIHPHVELDMNLNDRRVNLVEEGFDMAVRIGELEDSTLVARRITSMRIYTLASPTYLARQGHPVHPRDLEAHALLDYSNMPRARAWAFTQQHTGETYSVNRLPRVRANNGDALLRLAEAGLGVVRSPGFIADDALRLKRVESCLDGWDEEQTVYAIYPPGPHVPRRVRAFTDFLITRFGAMPLPDGTSLERLGEG